MRDYVYLKYRYQLIEWLRNYYPQAVTKFHKMKIEQLRAVYLSVRENLKDS